MNFILVEIIILAYPTLIIISITPQKESVEKQKKNIDHLLSYNVHITNEIEDLKFEVQNAVKQIPTSKSTDSSDSLSSDGLGRLRGGNHIEKGSVNCGGLTGYKYGSWGTKALTQQFSRPYPSPPVAFLALGSWASHTDQRLVASGARVREVNTTHISIACHRSQQEVGAWPYMYVNWITFPN